MSNMESVSIDVSRRIKAELYIAQFANGKLNPEKAADSCKIACYEGADRKNLRKRVLVCETEDMRYEGSNVSQDVPTSSTYCKQMLAAHNKRRNVVHLYDTQSFLMKPVFQKKEEEKDDDETDLSFREKTDNLTSAFGAIKKRRAMESRIRNKIGTESLATAMTNAVDDVLARQDGKDIVATPKIVDTAVEIPPYDKDGKQPSDVYKLEGILPLEAMTALEGPAQEFVSCNRDTLSTWAKETEFPTFIMNQLSILPMERTARMRKCKCLKYLHYMILLFGMKPKQLGDRHPFPPEVPQALQKLLLNSFTIDALTTGRKSSMRCMPARLKDKLLCYIFVLCLILENFNLDFSVLSSDLKIGQQRMITCLRTLGCRTKLEKLDIPGGKTISMGTATLPIPLTFPDLTVKTKKRRR